MQRSNEAMNVLAQQQSVSTVFARINARCKGAPVPMAARSAVQNEGSGQGWTMLKDYPFSPNGNAMFVVYGPSIALLGFCVGVCKYLPK
mmetsp:Transcript_51139/g.143046  ORF Transcript_51139/g.143046 Transcript_51139/m.143046 type:complete len:89 (+) Transcript_51139:91-357(+)